MQSVTLSLFRFGSATARIWAFAQMATARFALKREPKIGFFKLLGSGTGEGFTPIPNVSVYAILATWSDRATAEAEIAKSTTYARYRAHAVEDCTLYLSPTSARGEWDGRAPFIAEGSNTKGPIAALTRATVKPINALRFWRRVPDISQVIGDDPNVLFKIGVGEVPLLHQVTFSIWPDSASMAEFARRDGPHARAIKAVRDGAWFREELYARFRLEAVQGQWDGGHPLTSHSFKDERLHT